MADAAEDAAVNSENGDTFSEKPATDGEELLHRVRNLMRRVTAARSSPHPRFLHTLAAILEEEEARFEECAGQTTSGNPRSAHAIGRLVNLIRENDDFFELLSSKLMVETRHSTAVKAAAARLLLACLSCGMYPDVFEDAVLSNIKQWVTEDTPKCTVDVFSPRKSGTSKTKGLVSSDWDMLRTYSLGLLALALTTGGSIVEEVLATGLAAKLMHYLRVRVLKETKDSAAIENRTSGFIAGRTRDDVKNRGKLQLEVPQADGSQAGSEWLECTEKPSEREVALEKISCCDGDDDGDGTGEEKSQKRERKIGKTRNADPYCTGRDETSEAYRVELSKRNRGSTKIKGKGKISDGLNDGNKTGGAGRVALLHEKSKISRDSNAVTPEGGSSLVCVPEDPNTGENAFSHEGENEADEHYPSTVVGNVDISSPVKKAARAAIMEAKMARASPEAAKAAGEAAADLVKAAALEALGQSLDKEAVLVAALSAAASVEDAAAATKAIRKDLLSSSQFTEDSDKDEADFEFLELRDCALSVEALTSLREQFSVQCLQRLGEYLEVLGPVLRERGVDVCLALLQRESASAVSTKSKAMLCDVLKLICALAAHRKFSALFVDRGGVQMVLNAPRNSQTYTGISLCLFAFASVQGVMERVCTAPPEVVNEVVSLALHVLEYVQDPARRNAVLFFGASFVFKAILDAFDAQDGLRKMINLLQNAATIRSGGSFGMAGALPNSRTDRAASAEVLTSSEKQIAYHTCVALRQYLRAHLLILLDSIRPYRGRSGLRILPSGRAGYKPLDISNEAIENLILQIQRDRKLGPAFVRARWQMLEKFMSYSGHLVLLELTQVAPGERYLQDIAQHALGVLQIVTLMPSSRRAIVTSTLSNDRTSMAVILDAATATAFAEPEVIQAALLVLANLVCPPPSLSSRPNQPPNVSQASTMSADGRERHGKGDQSSDKNAADRPLQSAAGMIEGRDNTSKGEGISDRGGVLSQSLGTVSPGTTLVGDRRISLGSVAGGSGIAAYIEQGYRQAREAVRANNGIKVLLHLLSPRTVISPTALDCIRALVCRVLLGLARDDAIAHILTKLQVGKLLSELLRDGSSHPSRIATASGGGEQQGRWHMELSQVSMELIALVTNAGRASTLATSDAAAPTLRRIERAAIAAATPISYPSRELLQLIHEHLVLSGLPNAAAMLLKEAQLAPLLSVASQVPVLSLCSTSELSEQLIQWPAGRVCNGFMAGVARATNKEDELNCKVDQGSSRKKLPSFSSSLTRPLQSVPPSVKKMSGLQKEGRESATEGNESLTEFQITGSRLQSAPPSVKKMSGLQKEGRESAIEGNESLTEFLITGSRLGESDYVDVIRSSVDVINAPAKRKFLEREIFPLPNKRLAIGDREGTPPLYKSPAMRSCQTAGSGFLLAEREADKPQLDVTLGDNHLSGEVAQPHVPICTPTQSQSLLSPSTNLQLEPQSCQLERATLDSLVVQYLKHQHRQCPMPITTLPPLSLFHPHVCPEPSRASYAPYNVAKRLAAREVFPPYGGTHGRRRDKHYIYSRFRPLRPCRDERILLTSTTFLGTTFRLAAGSHAGEIRIFDCQSGDVLETHVCHQSSITLLQSSSQALASSVESLGSPPGHLLLSSASFDVRLWNSSALGEVPLFSFDGCRSARFNNSGSMFAAISSDSPREVLLYDVQMGQLEQKIFDTSSSAGVLRGNTQCIAHFSPSDSLLLWNGVLWDHRAPRAIHRFDQFTDYGGGGFHPAGNEVIVNSEVWDMRSYKLLRSVPSLDQTVITFNATGDVIYATLRRNLDDITSALHPRRGRHPLFSAFRTMDAVDYTDIATTMVDRCILDMATEPTDSLISVVALDGHDEMDSFAKLFEVGRRKPTDDDSDPDDGIETDDEEDSMAEEEAAEEEALHLDLDDSDLDESNNDGSGDEADEDIELEFDTNEDEDDEDAIGIEGSIVDIFTSDGETRNSFSSDDDGSLGDYDDDEDDEDFNDIL